MCVKCIYLHGPGQDKMTCDAFPEGIPDEILDGKNGHLKPYPGDNGIQFKHRYGSRPRKTDD